MKTICDYGPCGKEIKGKIKFTIVEGKEEKRFCSVACAAAYQEEN